MRKLFALLLSLSLSWVTAAYACEYAAMHVAQSACCCHEAQADQCPNPEHCQADVAKPGKACCHVVSLNGVQADDKALTNSVLHNLQPLAPLPASLAHTLVLSVSRANLHPAFADDSPPGWDTQTYFQTARLRI